MEAASGATSYDAAREIMGENFLGISGVSPFLGRFSQEDVQRLGSVPYSPDVLSACKDQYVLFADAGTSIAELFVQVPSKAFLGHGQAWYLKDDFALATVPASWCLLRRTEVPGSLKKSMDEQRKLLSAEDEVPSARQVTFLMMAMFQAIDHRLFRNVYVRTRDIGPNGWVHLGCFGESGMGIHDMYPEGRGSVIGLAAMRKIPS